MKRTCYHSRLLGLVVALLFIGLATGDALAATRITFWHAETPPHRVQTMQTLIDEFNRQNPEYQIVQETMTWDDAYVKLFAAFSAGSAPDMVVAIPDFGLAVQQAGMAQPVDDIVAEIDRRWDYVDSQLVPYYYQGHYWAVPLWGMTINLYYVPELLQEAGYDRPPHDWDELLDVAEKLSAKGIYPLAFPTSKTLWGDQVAYSFMATAGAFVFNEQGEIDFDNERTIRALEFFAKLGKYAPPGSSNWNWGDGQVAYVSGKYAMLPIFGGIRNWEQNAPRIAEATRGSYIPIAPGGQRASYSSPNAMMVLTADRAKREGIQKFLLFLMEPERNGWWLAHMEPGTYLPITEAGLKAESFWSHEVIARHRQLLEAHIDNQKYGLAYGFEYGPNEKIGPIAASNILAEVVQQVYTGAMTPEEAAAWGERRMRALVR